MQRPATVRIGTRKSPLALTQTQAFVRRLECRWPEARFRLVPIDTRGDKNRSVPLSTVNDALFFSAELDAALAAGEVDLCVHSLKDLPQERPFHAVLSERQDPRDAVLVRRDSVHQLVSGKGTVTLGTSTSRRASNVIDCINYIFAQNPSSEPRVRLLDIRGNIDERLAQLLSPEHRYDAIVLAVAGLNRLWSNASARGRLAEMLAATRWMVLPLEACPTAAGQGVLSVECRSDDANARELLGPFAMPRIDAEVAFERSLLAGIPEPDRANYGATAVHHDELGLIAWVRGRRTSAAGTGAGPIDARLHWNAPTRPRHARGWEGSRWSKLSAIERLPVPDTVWDAPAVFVAHSRALPRQAPPENSRIWAAGLSTWKALAGRGIWVEGCAEVLGFESLIPTLQCEVLGLAPLTAWRVMTHAGAVNSWREFGIEDVVATYKLEGEASAATREEVREATHFYWTSSLQYLAVREWLPDRARHACGPGKTLRALRQAGVPDLQVFPSVKEWRAWLA